jgi:hypothetical protein
MDILQSAIPSSVEGEDERSRKSLRCSVQEF